MSITIFNKHKETPAGKIIPIMRGRSMLANPFPITPTRTREQCLDQYKIWLWKHIKTRSKAYDELKKIYLLSLEQDIFLECCCMPKACHGTIIIDAIKWLRKEGWKYIHENAV